MQMPGIPQCSTWQSMCSSDSSLYLCNNNGVVRSGDAATASPSPSSMSGMPGGMSSMVPSTSFPANTPPCILNPADQACASYTYPESNITADLTSLCSAMGFMSACTLWAQCKQSGPTAVSTQADTCDGFSLLATVCKHDTGMSRMSGCRNYNALCNSTSLVPQCIQKTGLAHVPSTEMVR